LNNVVEVELSALELGFREGWTGDVVEMRDGGDQLVV
jgi:hypothetical protein